MQKGDSQKGPQHICSLEDSTGTAWIESICLFKLPTNSTEKIFRISAITDNDLGHSVTVCLEPCATTNKLQTMPMISVIVLFVFQPSLTMI